VADADEALGEQVQEEAAQELIARDGHHFLLIVVGRVTPAKGNLGVRQCDQTMLLGRDEVDETQLVGLKGVVKISHIVFNGTSLLRLDGFAPASRWEELSPANLDSPQVA
jgi:hypothetical protein